MAKRIPDRQCICCREMRPKTELIRIVKIDSDISLDRTGKMNGRGAYVCGKSDCIKSLIRHRSLDKAFRMHVSDEVYEQLIKESESYE